MKRVLVNAVEKVNNELMTKLNNIPTTYPAAFDA